MSLRNMIVSDSAAPEYVAVVTRYGANVDVPDGDNDTIIIAVFRDDAPQRAVLSTTAHGRAGLLSWAARDLAYLPQVEDVAMPLSELVEHVASHMLRFVRGHYAI